MERADRYPTVLDIREEDILVEISIGFIEGHEITCCALLNR
jgi:hypothetical protein